MLLEWQNTLQEFDKIVVHDDTLILFNRGNVIFTLLKPTETTIQYYKNEVFQRLKADGIIKCDTNITTGNKFTLHDYIAFVFGENYNNSIDDVRRNFTFIHYAYGLELKSDSVISPNTNTLNHILGKQLNETISTVCESLNLYGSMCNTKYDYATLVISNIEKSMKNKGVGVYVNKYFNG